MWLPTDHFCPPWTHPTQQIRVHTRLLDCGREEIRLWYYARAKDFNGSSKALMTMDELLAFFGVGKATIYRWLNRGEGVLWRRNKKARGYIELYLIGIKQVCKNLQLGPHKSVLGAIADIPLGDIASRFGAKAAATHLDALQCQRQAWWATIQNVPESIRQFVLKPWEKISSETSTGDTVENGANLQVNQYAFESNGWTIPGTSIAGIRKKTDWRCDRTIQRRLSKTHRQEHGLDPLPKLRVAEEVTNPDVMAALANSCSGYVVDNNRVYKLLKHTQHQFFMLKHCIYGEADIQLLGLRRLRGKVNQYLRA